MDPRHPRRALASTAGATPIIPCLILLLTVSAVVAQPQGLLSHPSTKSQHDQSNSPAPSLPRAAQSSGSISPINVTMSGDRTVFESSYLSNSFYAQGLIWLFYEDSRVNCEHHAGCLYYTTSTNGSNWATPVRVNNNAGEPLHTTDSDFSVYTNGTYVFYARYNETTFETTCNQGLFAREGKLSPSGSVAWGPEETIAIANSDQTYESPFISMDTTGQLWVGYMVNSSTGCGGNGTDLPQVIHSAGTDYTTWTGNTTLTTEASNNWHVALAQLPGGQMYATFWLADYSLQGKLYNGSSWGAEEIISGSAGRVNDSDGRCSGGVCLDVNSWLFAANSTLYALYFDNSTENYYIATRSGGSWNTPGNVAAQGDAFMGMNCCGIGGVYFNTQWYSLPDAASFDANGTFYLYYMLASSNQIDMWKGGAGGGWTKTTGIIQTSAPPYPDSITSYITSSTTSSFPPNGGIFYVTGSDSPYIYHFALILPLQNFGIDANPAATTAPVGMVTNSSIAVTSIDGFTGNVTLTTATNSTNLACTLSATTLVGGSGNSTLSCVGSVAGNYSANVTATGSGVNHSTTAVYEVQDFTLKASTPLPTLAGTTLANSTIMITGLNQLAGNATLSDNVPSGLNCTVIAPGVVTLVPSPSSALLSCNSSLVGNYTVTVTARLESLVHSTSVNFTIIGGPNGGFIVPINRLALLEPYLVVGLAPFLFLLGLLGHRRIRSGRIRPSFK